MDLIYVIYYISGVLSAYAFDDLSYKKYATQSHSYRDTIYEAVNRQRGRFAGFSLYVSNTGDIQGSSLCYKDGPQLPPLNFTTTCTEHGRYVIFYNERLNKESYPEGYEVYNVFTELCEVVVQGCKRSGVFGIDCDRPCPANCKDNICKIENGSCLKCKTGWSGTFCDTECMESWYGVNCSQKCVGHCKENSTCNQVTGQCDRGCAAGWTGTSCEKDCQPWYYGTNCSLACSPNCKTCRHTDDLCSCKAGWVGHNCSIECTQSYGENCQYSCSLHCINQTCDRFNGNCLCDDKHESLQNIETLNGPSCTLWIVFFSISMAIHIIFISVTLIGRRRTSLKQKSTTDQINFPGLNIDQTATLDDPAHYQELGNLKNENAYQTLHQRKN